MAKKPSVKCPGCGERFFREDVPFIHEKNRYWHTQCYKRVKEQEEKTALAQEQLDEYICKLFGTSYVSPRVRKQINSYVNNYNFTHSGILGSLKYWFEVKNGSIEKANGGIGIVPYIYDSASKYYQSIFNAQQVNRDVKEIEMETITVRIPSPKRKVRGIRTIDLEFLEEENVE